MNRHKVMPAVIATFALMGASLAADEPPLWDEFGVAMSAHEHAVADGNAVFDKSVASLQLTPVPLVSSSDRGAIDLCGQWNYLPNPPLKELNSLLAGNVTSWDRINVPADFAMEGKSAARALYQRPVTIPSSWRGSRVKLRFDEVASSATVWVGGEQVGQHIGHFIPFEFDITDQVTFGAESIITVLAQKESIARRVSGYALHVGGGITRGARCFAVPEVHIAGFHVVTQFDDAYRDAQLEVDLRLVNQGELPFTGGEIEFALTDPNGTPIVCSPLRVTVPILRQHKALSRKIRLAVSTPQHWTAETPNLYRLTVSLVHGGSKQTQVERRIGFRELEVRGADLLVNGRPVKLRGSNRHLAHPLRGRSITPEMARRDAELFKAANCNFVRTSHYPPSEEFIQACDEVGLYVEEEAAFCFFDYERMRDLKQEDVTRYVTYANMKIVERDRSHPSVVLWSIGNESKWGPHFEAAARAVSQADPTRPSTFMWYEKSFGELFDVAAAHYPGPDGVRRVEADKPKIFSEYCHMPAYAPLEMYTDPGVDDRWGEVVRQTWNNLYAAEGALGGAIWCGIDDVFHVPGTEQVKVQGVAPWGILDGWRRPKPEYWHTLKAYSPFRIATDRVQLPARDQPVSVPIENRYDFVNLNTLQVHWRLAGQKGVIQADVPPHGHGKLQIPVSSVKPGDVLKLKVTHPSGRLVDEYELPVGDPEPKPTSIKPANVTPWQLEEDADAFMVSRGLAVARISKSNGLIDNITLDGTPVVIGGPHFRFVPTFTRVQQRAMKHAPPALIPGYGSNWELEVLEASQNGDVVEICWKGRVDEAVIEGRYRFLPNGQLQLPYTIRLEPEVLKHGDLVWSKKLGQRGFAGWKNPHTALLTHANRGGDEQEVPLSEISAVPRQLGLELIVPRAMNTLEWKRDGLWSVYPPDHIGRLQGTANAISAKNTTEALRVEPSWSWGETGSELGTRDFRSTKHRIHRASLTASSGQGVAVLSTGRHSTRAFLQSDGVHWLITAWNGGPSEGFVDNYFGAKRVRIPLGDPIQDTIQIGFENPKR